MREQKSWQEKVVRTFGEGGKLWLQDLPNLIERSCDYWGLQEVEAVPNLSYNYVASATKRGERSSRVVLKLCCTQKDFNREFLALRGLLSPGCVPVLDSYREVGGILLPWAPGGTLKALSLREGHENIISLYGGVVGGLQKVLDTSKPTIIPTVEEQIEGLEDRARSFLGEFSIGAVRESRQDLKREPQGLIHGDLHLENILKFEEGWKAIDPKGTWGPLAFEVSAYDLLSRESAKLEKVPEKMMGQAMCLLAKKTSIPLRQLYRWVVLRCALSLVWFIEDTLDPEWPLEQLFYLEKIGREF